MAESAISIEVTHKRPLCTNSTTSMSVRLQVQMMSQSVLLTDILHLPMLPRCMDIRAEDGTAASPVPVAIEDMIVLDAMSMIECVFLSGPSRLWI